MPVSARLLMARLLVAGGSSKLQESITWIIDDMLGRIEANGPEFDGHGGLRARHLVRRCLAGWPW